MQLLEHRVYEDVGFQDRLLRVYRVWLGGYDRGSDACVFISGRGLFRVWGLGVKGLGPGSSLRRLCLWLVALGGGFGGSARPGLQIALGFRSGVARVLTAKVL